MEMLVIRNNKSKSLIYFILMNVKLEHKICSPSKTPHKWKTKNWNHSNYYEECLLLIFHDSSEMGIWFPFDISLTN